MSEPELDDTVRVPPDRDRLTEQLGSIPAEHWGELLLELVCSHTADVLGHPSTEMIEVDRAFTDQGFNSLAAVELYTRLAAVTRLELPLTMALSLTTPAAVADHLEELLRDGQEGSDAEDEVQPSEDSSPREQAAHGRERNASEPIAIVGIGCRYPGNVSCADDLWDLVAEGRHVASSFPIDRGWDRGTDSSASMRGGFVDGATDFDYGFFGIGPREALAMDPQQRLMLETAWEALEDAGIDPGTLAASPTGVFAGTGFQDYSSLLSATAADVEGLLVAGLSGSAISGRIAYALNLQGTTFTVDSACSSSLAAVHLACQALRHDECSLALAGGVTVMSTPSVFTEFSRLGGLSRDGLCRSFSGDADGVGFSEGVGLIVLERLDDARRSDHRILALVRGSAMNHDGASNGFMAPSSRAQEQVIRQALANANLSGADIDAVDGHGTGTALGDPVELQALASVYGRERLASRPLWLGSIKSNLGHPQAAAGVAGIIKMVMAMRHERLPKTLHLAEPGPRSQQAGSSISLLSEAAPWPRADRTRRAGVSSFGVSGSNVHLLLEEPPAGVSRASEQSVPLKRLAWVLSGRTKRALRDQALRLAQHLDRYPTLASVDVAYSLATTRSQFEHRAVITGEDRVELLDGLQALAGESSSGGGSLAQGKAKRHGKTAMMFSGQGSQWPGMGKELYDGFPAFTEAIDSACSQLDARLAQPLLDVMFAAAGSPEAKMLDETAFTQPALFALEVALFRLLETWGVEPDYLVGHSIGELAAAHVAGVLSLADASTLVAARGMLMQELPSGGAMISVQASEDEVLPTLTDIEDRCAIAAVNGPTSVVVSGAHELLVPWAVQWTEAGRSTTWLPVSHAFHSSLMDPMLARFADVAGGLSFSPPQIPIVSTLNARPIPAEEVCSPRYWVRQAREPVRFSDAIGWLRQAGVYRYLELGPSGVLSALGRGCLAGRDVGHADGRKPVFVPALRARRSETPSLISALASVYLDGGSADWVASLAAPGKRVPLPTYAFQRKRCWPDRPGGSSWRSPLAATNGQTAASPELMHGDSRETHRRASAAGLLELVRTHVAVVLGHEPDAIEAQRTFAELGMDSVKATELHRRIAETTGLRLSPTAISDHPSVGALASYLGERSTAEAGENDCTPNAWTGMKQTETLTALLEHAHESGAAIELIALLRSLSRFQPSFGTYQERNDRPSATLVVSGAAAPALICVPSFVVGSGPHQFMRFAAALRGRLRVYGAWLPGFREADRLPASLDIALEALATAIQSAAGDGPFAVVGYSSGGVLAHAVTERLEARGVAPSGVILLDTYAANRDELGQVLAGVVGRLVERNHADHTITDRQLLAMGAYLRLLEDWVPATLTAPSIVLRAREPLHAAGRAGHLASWQADRVIEVEGDHFSMMEENAETTAQTVRGWLREVHGSGLVDAAAVRVAAVARRS
jgi:acyl transferase domain-containing protein